MVANHNGFLKTCFTVEGSVWVRKTDGWSLGKGIPDLSHVYIGCVLAGLIVCTGCVGELEKEDEEADGEDWALEEGKDIGIVGVGEKGMLKLLLWAREGEGVELCVSGTVAEVGLRV